MACVSGCQCEFLSKFVSVHSIWPYFLLAQHSRKLRIWIFATVWNWISRIYSCSQKPFKSPFNVKLFRAFFRPLLLLLLFIHSFIYSAFLSVSIWFCFFFHFFTFHSVSHLMHEKRERKREREMFTHSFDERLTNSNFFFFLFSRNTSSHSRAHSLTCTKCWVFTLPKILYLSTSTSI